MSNTIETSELKKVYGQRGFEFHALKGINLTVEKGEFLGIMGPSGSGKTTLLNLISTIDKQTSGKIIFNGQDMSSIKTKDLSRFRRDNIGFIFQDYNLLDNMSIEDNISLPLALNKVPHKEIKQKVDKLSTFFGIEAQIKKYPYQLSGGQKQRVAAARALITSPTVIFADEPTGALDSRSATELLNCLADMNTKFNTTIIMVTHDAFAASFCKRILFLADGQIHAKLNQNTSRKELYQRILTMMASLGEGEQNELF
ncbi:MAG: ABC transporter ATP-binding protein [Clostridiaceae bacterium]|nr:ABC transporter ATP-binding protein [Clostridiaceae bacterium]